MDQHDDVEGQIVANVKQHHEFEQQRQVATVAATGSFLASRKPPIIASVSDTELTMLSPK